MPREPILSTQHTHTHAGACTHMYTTHNLQTGNEHGLLTEEDSSMRQENMPGLPFSKKEMS